MSEIQNVINDLERIKSLSVNGEAHVRLEAVESWLITLQRLEQLDSPVADGPQCVGESSVPQLAAKIALEKVQQQMRKEWEAPSSKEKTQMYFDLGRFAGLALAAGYLDDAIKDAESIHDESTRPAD